MGKKNAQMTIENLSDNAVIAFTSIEIYRKTQLGLNICLLLTHTVHLANIPNIYLCTFITFFNYALSLLIYINSY